MVRITITCTRTVKSAARSSLCFLLPVMRVVMLMTRALCKKTNEDQKLKAQNLLLLLLLLLFIFGGCVTTTYPKLTLTNNITAGIYRSELVKVLGEPISSQYKDDYFVLQYFLTRNDGFPVTYYFVFDGDKKLIKWEQLIPESNEIKVKGTIIKLGL